MMLRGILGLVTRMAMMEIPIDIKINICEYRWMGW